MSRLRVREALADRVEEVREQLSAGYDRFRESRLYVQTVCAAVLVSTAWLIHLLPFGPLARAQAAVEWVVAGDYDFRGKTAEVSGWARARGGWGPAMAGLWNQGIDQARDWVGPIGPFAEQTAASTGQPSPAAGPAGSSKAPPAAGQNAFSTDQASTRPASSLEPLRPVDGAVILWEYGWLPQEIGEEFHEGIDFHAEPGTPVVAVLDGTVVAIRQDQRLGGLVEIRHEDVIAVYAQVEAISVRAGDRVRRGEMIAVVSQPRGSEAKMSPHLHLEIRPLATGEPVDPASYLGLGGKKL
ncbi:MAG: peptidoglycan DD-metalloendopeptidase family protein [Bacillota bacterium]